MSRTRLQWIAHQALVEHAPGFSAACTRGGVLEPWASSDFLGKSWGNLELAAKFWDSPAGNSGKIWEFCIIRRHRSRVHQSRPESRRDLSHMTQPRARINVSCSRANDRGSRGLKKTTKGPREKASEGWVPGQQRVGVGPGYQITDDIAPLIHSASESRLEQHQLPTKFGAEACRVLA